MLPAVDLLLQGRGGFAAPGYLWVLWLVILVVDVLLIVAVWKSRKATMVKVVWTLIIVFTSVIGWILYFFLGREK